MRFWRVARWVLLVVCVVAIMLVFVRGPEDTWVRDSQGNWVAHGHPASPPPPAGYHPPAAERAGPYVLVAVLLLALFAALLMSGRSPSGTEALAGNIQYLGAVSVICTAIAVAVALSLVLGMGGALGAAFRDPTLVVLTLLAVALASKLLSWQAYTAKKVIEAHYDLKRAVALLQDTMERLHDSTSDQSGPAAA